MCLSWEVLFVELWPRVPAMDRQIVRLGFSRVILCEPRRPAGRRDDEQFEESLQGIRSRRQSCATAKKHSRCQIHELPLCKPHSHRWSHHFRQRPAVMKNQFFQVGVRLSRGGGATFGREEGDAGSHDSSGETGWRSSWDRRRGRDSQTCGQDDGPTPRFPRGREQPVDVSGSNESIFRNSNPKNFRNLFLMEIEITCLLKQDPN